MIICKGGINNTLELVYWYLYNILEKRLVVLSIYNIINKRQPFIQITCRLLQSRIQY